jgi:uncharacterized protein (TIGR03083 family)
MEMQHPDPVQVLDLFAPERDALLQLLGGLTPADWARSTVCGDWSVHDVALHILGGYLGNLSRRRDGYQGPAHLVGDDLVGFINRFNEEWVEAARRLSPAVLIDLLRQNGPQLDAYFATLDPLAPGGGVSWAGLDPAPVWLDVAREYTEHWLHQQHIRMAVGQPGATERRFLYPVLATYVYALPYAYRAVAAPPGTALHLHIAGDAGGDWSLVREGAGWTLYEGTDDRTAAGVALADSLAWQLFTKGVSPDEAAPAMTFTGDEALGRQVLQAVAIIA